MSGRGRPGSRVVSMMLSGIEDSRRIAVATATVFMGRDEEVIEWVNNRNRRHFTSV